MESVGKQLRSARLRLGFTLDDISADCRIPVRTLAAIESDRLDGFDAPFFYRSFVRQFADRVNLNFSEIEPAVRAQASTLPEPGIPGQAKDGMLSNMPPISASRPRRFRSIVSVASLFAVVLAGSSFYGFWQNARAAWHSAAQIVPEKSADSQSAPLGQAGPESTAKTPQSPEYRVELSALERTWLSIMADGRQIFKGVLEPDDKRILEGRQFAQVYSRNLGALRFIFNGRAIGTLGENGTVSTVVFTTNNYKLLESPAHISLTSFTPDAKPWAIPADVQRSQARESPFADASCCAPSE